LRSELEESLTRRYPDMFADAGKIWCDDGWYDIIDSACSCISMHVESRPIKFKFTQVKEKFAGLRMYSEGADEFIRGVISLAETLSYRTCEVTGSPGVRCVRGGYIRTLSPSKAEELEFTVVKK
jgi:hypothetical protein